MSNALAGGCLIVGSLFAFLLFIFCWVLVVTVAENIHLL